MQVTTSYAPGSAGSERFGRYFFIFDSDPALETVKIRYPNA